jgi:ribulose kinase
LKHRELSAKQHGITSQKNGNFSNNGVRIRNLPAACAVTQKLLICDKSATTQNLAFLSYWYGEKKTFADAHLTGIVS